jgi:hypothetical protein
MWPRAHRDSPQSCYTIDKHSISHSDSFLRRAEDAGKGKECFREGEEGNCVTSFRLDAVSAPRDAPFPAQHSVRRRHPINSYPHTHYPLPPSREATQPSVPNSTLLIPFDCLRKDKGMRQHLLVYMSCLRFLCYETV